MRIIVNGKDAVLKKGTSFELVSENRAFTDADSYSFSISFPLKGCQENIDIFGFLHRNDSQILNSLFDCEIIDSSFNKVGTLTVTEISEIELKAQFLEGRSSLNLKNPFEEIYINSLDLRGPETTDKTVIPPLEAWKSIDEGHDYVALPWVNNHTGNVQNDIIYSNGEYSWAENPSGLSWQPYLIFITKQIFNCIGYSFDLSKWENHQSFKYLLICNSIPFAWKISNFSAILPKWTINEFLKELELFMGAEFDIDHKKRHIEFSFSTDVIKALTPVKIDKLLDSFSTEIDDESMVDYVATSTFKFKDGAHNMSKYYSADWFVEYYKNDIVYYDTLDDLLSDSYFLKFHLADYEMVGNTWGPTKDEINKFHFFNSLFYVKNIDTYFVVSAYKTGTADARPWVASYLLPINSFNPIGSSIDENTPEIELNLVPVCIDEADLDTFGFCMFLNPGSLDTSYETSAYWQANSYPLQIIKEGEKSKPESFYDLIFLAFWDGTNIQPGGYPIPFVDNIFVRSDWTYSYNESFSLRLNRLGAAPLRDLAQINPKQKYQFSFFSDTIPNVRSVFFIDGKKYLCEKITATFSENGMSQLLKGSFYRIID